MATSTNQPPADRTDGPTDPIRRDYRPTGTYDKPTTFGVLRRTVTEFSEDNLTDWAAALTYYGLLALFPALIALVSLVGLRGPGRGGGATDLAVAHQSRDAVRTGAERGARARSGAGERRAPGRARDPARTACRAEGTANHLNPRMED